MPSTGNDSFILPKNTTALLMFKGMCQNHPMSKVSCVFYGFPMSVCLYVCLCVVIFFSLEHSMHKKQDVSRVSSMVSQVSLKSVPRMLQGGPKCVFKMILRKVKGVFMVLHGCFWLFQGCLISF